MKKNQFMRTEILIGKENVEKIKKTIVIIYGIGGVGSFVAEGLARTGIGHLILVDDDTVDITNLNRQIEALHSTIGMKKTEVMKQRILDINPNAKVDIYSPSEIKKGEENLIKADITYVVDAVDTMTNKLKIIEKAYNQNVRIISIAGTAKKMHPTMLEVSDIYKTSICPVCKLLRKELRKKNITKLKVVYSKEEPGMMEKITDENGKEILGSISFVPSVAGMIAVSEIINDIINEI